MKPSKTQRWLDILAVLIGRRSPVPIEEIMQNVPAYRVGWTEGDDRARATARRKFERDKDELRKLGIPIETRTTRSEGVEQEGYAIFRRDFYLPILNLLETEDDAPAPTYESPHRIGAVTLTEEDARTAVRALREVLALPSFPFPTEARGALRKLTFDLDPMLHEAAPDAEPSRLRVLDRPGGSDPDGALPSLLDGLYERQPVRFRYHSIHRDADEEREVEPWGLLYQWGAWYLIARDPSTEDDELRRFRVDRMSAARRLRPDATRPAFEVPASFDIHAFVGREAWELGEESAPTTAVHVRFEPLASRLADRNGWGRLEAEDEEGRHTRSFEVRRLDPLLRRVLSLAGEAEVVSPPEAVEAMRTMASNVLSLYGGEA